MSETLYAPKCGLPVDATYVRAYGIGYFYGRQVGDKEPGRDEMALVYGPSDRTNVLAYEGFSVGYEDGVSDYAEIHDETAYPTHPEGDHE